MASWKEEREKERNRQESLLHDDSDNNLADLEGEILAELNDVQKGFRERAAKENQRFVDVCDTGYWFCVCFTSRAQKVELLEKLGLNIEEKYIDGREFAKKVNRALETPDLQFPQVRTFDKEFVRLSKEP